MATAIGSTIKRPPLTQSLARSLARMVHERERESEKEVNVVVPALMPLVRIKRLAAEGAKKEGTRGWNKSVAALGAYPQDVGGVWQHSTAPLTSPTFSLTNSTKQPSPSHRLHRSLFTTEGLLELLGELLDDAVALHVVHVVVQRVAGHLPQGAHVHAAHANGEDLDAGVAGALGHVLHVVLRAAVRDDDGDLGGRGRGRKGKRRRRRLTQ